MVDVCDLSDLFQDQDPIRGTQFKEHLIIRDSSLIVIFAPSLGIEVASNVGGRGVVYMAGLCSSLHCCLEGEALLGVNRGPLDSKRGGVRADDFILEVLEFVFECTFV